MNSFLSYSLNDRDQYILTLLSSELKQRGFSVAQSNDFNQEMSSLTKVNINKSQIFIGIITGNGLETDRVHKEWRLANVAQIPSILMIENSVPINSNFKQPYILFDRNNPQFAIDELTKKTEAIKLNSDQNSNGWAWVLGGAALIAIISLFSKDDN